ncbi:hypothetical protein GEMRC1_004538 [Eukaryota sp. GEM-RC1]
MKNAFLFILIISFIVLVAADSCKDFRAKLKHKFYDGHKVLGYKLAREYMYNWIDNYDNHVECVYGGYLFPFKPTNGTDIKYINCEHTIPQSFFSKKNPMVSDLYHLFPSYDKFNSIRSNYPFKNLTVEETEKWMIDMEVVKQLPKHSQEYSWANRKVSFFSVLILGFHAT